MRSMFYTTALASAMALAAPALAQDAPVGADVGAEAGAEPGGGAADIGAGAPAPVDGAVETDAAVEAQPTPGLAAPDEGMMDPAAVTGLPVVTSDEVTVGTITEVETDVNGEASFIAEVSDELALEAPMVRIRSDAATVTGDQVRLQISQAEFASFASAGAASPEMDGMGMDEMDAAPGADMTGGIEDDPDSEIPMHTQ